MRLREGGEENKEERDSEEKRKREKEGEGGGGRRGKGRKRRGGQELLLKTNDGRGGDENDLCLIIMTQNEIILFWNVDPSTHKKKTTTAHSHTKASLRLTRASSGRLLYATVCVRGRKIEMLSKTAVDNVK